MTHPPISVEAEASAERARVAFAERRWSDAIELLRIADAGGALTAADLDAYARIHRTGSADRLTVAEPVSGWPRRRFRALARRDLRSSGAQRWLARCLERAATDPCPR